MLSVCKEGCAKVRVWCHYEARRSIAHSPLWAAGSPNGRAHLGLGSPVCVWSYEWIHCGCRCRELEADFHYTRSVRLGRPSVRWIEALGTLLMLQAAISEGRVDAGYFASARRLSPLPHATLCIFDEYGWGKLQGRLQFGVLQYLSVVSTLYYFAYCHNSFRVRIPRELYELVLYQCYHSFNNNLYLFTTFSTKWMRIICGVVLTCCHWGIIERNFLD